MKNTLNNFLIFYHYILSNTHNNFYGKQFIVSTNNPFFKLILLLLQAYARDCTTCIMNFTKKKPTSRLKFFNGNPIFLATVGKMIYKQKMSLENANYSIEY